MWNLHGAVCPAHEAAHVFRRAGPQPTTKITPTHGEGGGGLPVGAESIRLSPWWSKIVFGRGHVCLVGSFSWARSSWTMESKGQNDKQIQNTGAHMRDLFSTGQYMSRSMFLSGPPRVEPGSHGRRCHCHGPGRGFRKFDGPGGKTRKM